MKFGASFLYGRHKKLSASAMTAINYSENKNTLENRNSQNSTVLLVDDRRWGCLLHFFNMILWFIKLVWTVCINDSRSDSFVPVLFCLLHNPKRYPEQHKIDSLSVQLVRKKGVQVKPLTKICSSNKYKLISQSWMQNKTSLGITLFGRAIHSQEKEICRCGHT